MTKSRDEIKYRDPVRKMFVDCLLKNVLALIRQNKAQKILDIGCGEGYPHRYFTHKASNLRITGIDMHKEGIEKAKNKNPAVNYQVGDLYSLKIKEQFDLVLLMEVLEHLENPSEAVLKIRNLAALAIITVPYESWFSLLSFLSGKYLKTLGKHPDHLNFWHKNTLQNLLEKYYSKVQIKVSFPWLIAVCKK